MTATRVWYPHYIDDFNRKTGHLSLAERGAYRALMDAYWQRQGPLPADERALCRMIGAFPDEWEAVRARVLAFFEERDGMLHQRRCDKELKKARKQYESKAARLATARARRWAGKQHADQSPDHYTDHSSDHSSDINSDHCTDHYRGTPSPLPSQGSIEPPDVCLGEEFWKSYPHPPNRGSKARTVEKINALPEADQRAALSSLAAHRAAIAKTRERHADFQPCMAETFVNGRRWEGLAPAERQTPDIEWPDDEDACARAKALAARIGAGAYVSYFSRSPPRLEGDRWRVTPPTRTVADRMELRFGPALDDVYGKGAWRIDGVK